jgi:aminoglycoside phosphotransferase (APT) family kinase protein
MTEGPGSETWRALVDLDRLKAWMDAKGLGGGEIECPALLAGGTQNVLLRFRRGERELVLRRPPARPRGDGNATILREVRVLAALAGTDVPHPRLIALCPSEEVLGAAFYLMEAVRGFNATVALPGPMAQDAALRRRMGFALVEGALALGRVDHAAAGLSDFGRPDGFLARQVSRWKGQLDSYREFQGWPGPAGIPGVSRVGAWLEENCPRRFSPGLMHGDYHIGNVMFRPDEPELAAIVDWELATIGDPLLDLGWIMATWPGPGGETTSEQTIRPWEGFPVIEELVAHYAAFTSRDMSDIRWYGVLGCYKLGLILEGTYARACASLAPRATGDRLHNTCLKLFRRALEMLERA